MDPSKSGSYLRNDASFSIIDLSAPPAYARFEQNPSPSASSRSSTFVAASSISVFTKPTSSSLSSAGTGAHKPSTPTRTSSSSKRDYRKPYTTATCRSATGAAPDYSVGAQGEMLSEKDPRGPLAPAPSATQQSISHDVVPPSPHSRASSARGPSPTSSSYPPTSSRDESSSLCGCFHSLPPRVKLWLSFGAWVATSLGFLLAIAFWKTEVFTALDNLSGWLVQEGYTGFAYMFSLIVLTTIPPFPLYSTLMMLAGYTWGTWTGFVLSYTSSLFGAIVVYFISRYFFGSSLVSLLRHMPSFARTVRAVARNPKLLFLIRLAPYPYNVMNVLLAACPSLRWRTYIGCTALSLLKVVIHTSIGSGIRSFKNYHGVGESDIDSERPPSEEASHELAKWSTIIGVILCVLLFIYLGHIARKAVDHELEDEDFYDCPSTTNGTLLPVHHHHHHHHPHYHRLRDRDDLPRSPLYSASRHHREPSTAEERMAFLSPVGNDNDSDEEESSGPGMSESRFLGDSIALTGNRHLRR